MLIFQYFSVSLLVNFDSCCASFINKGTSLNCNDCAFLKDFMPVIYTIPQISHNSNIKKYTGASTGFPGGSASKESACNVQCLGLGRSAGEGNSDPLQYYGLENPMDCPQSDTTE